MEEKEIYPIMNNLLIEIYFDNPYKKIVKENEVEMTEDFVNPDSGLVEKLENTAFFGKVIEAGPECEFVKAGDDVLFDHRAVFPAPFFGHDLWVLNEVSVKAIIAEGLSERFKKD